MSQDQATTINRNSDSRKATAINALKDRGSGSILAKKIKIKIKETATGHPTDTDTRYKIQIDFCAFQFFRHMLQHKGAQWLSRRGLDIYLCIVRLMPIFRFHKNAGWMREATGTGTGTGAGYAEI